MYLGNRVEETTLTTGAGDLTLAGAKTNYRTFNSAFGTTRRFHYWIVDETNNVWENGIGYLSTATNLVREKVLSNSSGTLSPLVLGAATKRVFCGADEFSFAPAWPSVNSGGNGVRVGHANQTFTADNIYPLQANQFQAMPYLLLHGGRVSALEVDVASASGQADSFMRLGIYADNGWGRPGVLLAETGDIDINQIYNSAHNLTSAIYLSPGWYYTGCVSRNIGTLRVRKRAGDMLPSPMGFVTSSGGTIAHGGQVGGYATWTSMPNPAPELTTLYSASSIWGMLPTMRFSE